MSILVVGSVALDTLKSPTGECKDVLGGSATYFSVSASFFTSVNLVAVVGKDFPVKYTKLLESKKVDLRGLEFAEGKTFRWEGEYGRDFNNAKTISTHLNVFSNFNPRIPEEYKQSKYLFLANIDPELQENVLNQVTRPSVVACDTMNFWIQNKCKYLLRLLKRIDIFFLNEQEAKELSGESNLIKAAKAIIKCGPKKIIIKRGEHGAVLFSKNSIFYTPAFLLEEVFDPTGAGDTFAGGVMGYLAKANAATEVILRKAIVYGSVMAAFAVEDFSLRRLIAIRQADIAKRVKKYKKSTCYGL
ncbi:MAG: bifunctional hydroxymethylpyrimidine kinase/phosphomethylpyrimidine kinase [Candidatus Omnitrophica bacterium]|nr:bifunctional hydroxymethylpyrimidine kinase/phosphomethylpyrimidine kinase [Candidatus Omnitrophota bacterium]